MNKRFYRRTQGADSEMRKGVVRGARLELRKPKKVTIPAGFDGPVAQTFLSVPAPSEKGGLTPAAPCRHRLPRQPRPVSVPFFLSAPAAGNRRVVVVSVCRRVAVVSGTPKPRNLDGSTIAEAEKGD